VSLTLQGFSELTKNEKDELFESSIQAYIQYLEELKQKGKKLAIKIISHACRSYKSKLVKIWRTGPFMRACSKLTDSSDVSYYSKSTMDVAQRALRESSEDSNGERENDSLSKALQTKEQQGHVRVVSSKVTWKEGFLEHKSMYRMQKMTSTQHVEVEELKRQLRREVLGDLRPILGASGIQFPNIGVVMSDKERSSLASIATGGGRPHEDL
jgi:hypothetical protein